jgi:hypothetical protein
MGCLGGEDPSYYLTDVLDPMTPPPSEVSTEPAPRRRRTTRAGQATTVRDALLASAGFGIRRFASHCLSIIQQHFVTGWGGLRPQAAGVAPAAAPAHRTCGLFAKRTRRATK